MFPTLPPRDDDSKPVYVCMHFKEVGGDPKCGGLQAPGEVKRATEVRLEVMLAGMGGGRVGLGWVG